MGKAIQWADVDLILKVLLPVEMPNFDSLKSNSITTDLVGLLKKILRLAPDAAYDSQCIKTDQLVKFLEFPARREEIGSMKRPMTAQYQIFIISWEIIL